MTTPTTSLTKTASQVDYILVDCSSSMADKWHDTIGAVDAYAAQLKLDGVKSDIYLHMFFDANVGYIHRETTVSAWTPLLGDCPDPQGMTPLYDAVEQMGRRLRAMDPPRAAITIVTDGGDSGTGLPVERARQICDWIRAKGWQLTFIGADFSNSRMAQLLGASAAESIGVQKRLLANAARELAKKRRAYEISGAPMHWSPSEQQQFGGYLAAPPK